MADLPTGTVTFLMTDIEGSTALWEQHRDATRSALARHDALIEALVAEHYGVLVRPRGEGDSRFAVFGRATDAVTAAGAIQQALYAEQWSTPLPLRVRIGLHTGESDLRAGDYYGSAVNRCARLRAVAHGGQILVSLTTEQLLRGQLPSGVSLRDLGEHRLKDLQHPERIFQLVVAGIAADFPPLRMPDDLPRKPLPYAAPVRVLIADDQRLMRDGLASLLDIQPGISVVGTATNGQDALEQARRLQPDVTLMDVQMPVLDGVAATAALRRELPSCQVLMLTTFDDEDYVVAALRVGACGYLLKDIPAPDLAQAIHAAHNGIYQLNAAVAAKVVASLAASHRSPFPAAGGHTEPALPSNTPAGLTERELDVLRLVAQGLSDKEVAETLILSPRTVQRHLTSIYSKLGVASRHAATRFAIDHHLA